MDDYELDARVRRRSEPCSQPTESISALLAVVNRHAVPAPVEEHVAETLRIRVQGARLRARASLSAALRQELMDVPVLRASRIERLEQAVAHAFMELCDEVEDACMGTTRPGPGAREWLERCRLTVEHLLNELEDELQSWDRAVAG